MWSNAAALLLVVVYGVAALPPDEGDQLPGKLGSPAPRIKVWGGTIEGVVKRSEKGRRYFAYMGIPYARAPLKDRRFKVKPSNKDSIARFHDSVIYKRG